MKESDIVNEWFRFANNDLVVARICFEGTYPKQIENSCYHCEQCAEKALKGYLVYKGIKEPPKIHDLEKLCMQCINIDDSFSELLNICANLTPLATIVRYPNELAPDDDITKEAIENAQKVYDFCKSKIIFLP